MSKLRNAACKLSHIFDFALRLYTFFALPTCRCHVLVSSVGPDPKVVKRLSNTQWSALVDELKAVYDSYEGIQATLDSLPNYNDQPRDTLRDVQVLSKTNEQAGDGIFDHS